MRLIFFLFTITFYLNISYSSTSYSKIKMMTFNTMCDFCKGSDFFDYKNRVKSLAKIITQYQLDIIALQEVRTLSQVRSIISGQPESKTQNKTDYKIVATESWFMSYADPAIVYNQKKYTEISRGQFWLGPDKESLNFGWKVALPRQVLWVKLLDIKTNKNFIVMTSHFDNRIENLTGAALLVNKLISSFDIPVIFAADTNLTVDMDQYQKLTTSVLENAYDIAKTVSIDFKESEKELCYLKKGKKFPSCRVDHFLLSKKDKWSVDLFKVDQTKNHKGLFPSDHRPIYIELKLF